MKHILWNM